MDIDSRPINVYGIQLTDRKTAKLVRGVLVLSVISAAVAITLAVLDFTIFEGQNSVSQTVISLIIGISIPMVGWFGAWLTNRLLVGLFCSLSFSLSLFNLISYILIIVGIDYTIDILRNCNPDGTVVINGQINSTICKNYTEDSLRNIYIIASAVSIPMILLQCLSGVFGSRLYGRMSPEVVVTYRVDPPTHTVGTTFVYPQATVVSHATVIGANKGKGSL